MEEEDEKEKEALYKQISTTFIHSWVTGLHADTSLFLAQFSPTVDWYDHAFFIRHKGLNGMADFRTTWLTAIKDFGIDVEAIDVIKGGTVIRCVYHGTMVGKLPGRPASGKSFRTKVIILLGIGEGGKIERVDEYYTARVDEGMELEGYRLMGARRKQNGSEKL